MNIQRITNYDNRRCSRICFLKLDQNGFTTIKQFIGLNENNEKSRNKNK